jgi:MSHA pilin protein MshC
MRLSAEQVEAIKQDAGKFHRVVQVRQFDRQVGVNQSGFTLVELVMTMVIVGIIAAVAVPRFSGSSVFQSRGFADQVQASLRYAQKEAIAQRSNVCVTMTASTITLTIANASGAASACGPNLALPAPTPCGSNCISSPSAAITLAGANFNFDALGKPWNVLNTTPTTVKKTITISGAANQIFVEPETGYVHSP